MYTIRTRNRSDSPIAKKLLKAFFYGPMSERYFRKTNYLIVGLVYLAYAKIISRFYGGGRTFIESDSNTESKHEYKTFYL